MKRGTGLKGLLFGALALVALPLMAQDETPATTAGTAAGASAADALGTIIINDVRGLADSATALAKKLAPENPQTDLRGMAGMLVGDPELAGFPKGAGAMAYILQGGGMGFAEVEAAKQDAYIKLLQSRGLQTAKAEGMVLVATSAELLASAKKVARDAKKQLEGGEGGGIQLKLPLAKLLKQYDPQVTALIGMLPAKMAEAQQNAGGEDTTAPASNKMMTTLIDAEVRLAYRLLKNVDTLVVALTPSAEGLMMDWRFAPVGASKTAATGTLPTVESLRNLVSGQGAYRAVMVFDNKGVTGFLRKELDAVLVEMNVDEKVRTSIGEMLGTWQKLGGNGIGYDMIIPGQPMMSGGMVIAVNDPATALDDIEKMIKQMESAGIREMYSEMGIPVSWEFKRKAREIEGKEVAQFIFAAEETTTSTPQATTMARMMKDAQAEMTVAGNYLVYSFGKGTKLEDAVSAVKAGKHPQAKPLLAETAMGAGGRMYVDYHIGEIFASTAETMPGKEGEQIKKMADAVKGASPMTFAGFHNADGYRFSMMMPVDMMLSLAKNAQAAQAGAATETSTDDSETTGNTSNVE